VCVCACMCGQSCMACVRCEPRRTDGGAEDCDGARNTDTHTHPISLAATQSFSSFCAWAQPHAMAVQASHTRRTTELIVSV
jgi:hypothetical protein